MQHSSTVMGRLVLALALSTAPRCQMLLVILAGDVTSDAELTRRSGSAKRSKAACMEYRLVGGGGSLRYTASCQSVLSASTKLSARRVLRVPFIYLPLIQRSAQRAAIQLEIFRPVDAA